MNVSPSSFSVVVIPQSSGNDYKAKKNYDQNRRKFFIKFEKFFMKFMKFLIRFENIFIDLKISSQSLRNKTKLNTEIEILEEH